MASIGVPCISALLAMGYGHLWLWNWGLGWASVPVGERGIGIGVLGWFLGGVQVDLV